MTNSSVNCVKAVLLALLLALALELAIAQPPLQPRLSVDWSSFLSRADPMWAWRRASPSSWPSSWTQSLFGGNGALGFMLWVPADGGGGVADGGTLRVDVSRVDVYDDRDARLGTAFTDDFIFDQPRLPIGHLLLRAPGDVFESASARIVLADGVVRGVLETSAGAFGFALYANAAWQSADVIVLETNATWNVTWVPELAASTQAGPNYVPNPAPVTRAASSTTTVTTQLHLVNTSHSTAVAKADATTAFLSISPVLDSAANSDAWAAAQVAAAAAAPAGTLLAEHEAFWHGFYASGGFVTFNSSRLEAFWWLQLYKFGSAARAGRGIVHDLEGPWFVDGTPWPDLHWDLNLQQTYWLPLVANHLELSTTLTDFVQATAAQMSRNVRAEWQHDSAAAPTGASALSAIQTCYWEFAANCTTEPPTITGNLLWLLLEVHRHALFSGNASVDTLVVWPLLEKSLNFYGHFHVVNESDGRIHLPATYSPEYPGPPGPDANYDLALYRWGLQTALHLAAQYNLTSPSLPSWPATLAALAGPSVDPAGSGLEIYAGVPYGQPHRHFSHLFAVFPARTLDLGTPAGRALAEVSLDTWLATPELDSLFFRPAAAHMNVMLGRLPAAWSNLTFLVLESGRIEANTFYREGTAGSCTETPYAGAWAIADWLLQSHNDSFAPGEAGLIDVFPGVSDMIDLFSDAGAAEAAGVALASFFRLAAEGGFVVSAARRLDAQSSNASFYATNTAWLSVESRFGASLRVRTSLARPLVASGPPGISLTELGDRVVLISGVGAGDAVMLYSASAPPSAADLVVSPAAGCAADFNYWGLSATPSPAAQLLPCGSLPPLAQWRFDNATGQLSVRDGSGRCLARAGGGGADNTAVVLAACAIAETFGSAGDGCIARHDERALISQQWQFVAAHQANLVAASVPGECVSIFGGDSCAPPDCAIVLWACADSGCLNQSWLLDEETGALTTLDTAPQLTGLCLWAPSL
jgi:hypothetical protein